WGLRTDARSKRLTTVMHGLRSTHGTDAARAALRPAMHTKDADAILRAVKKTAAKMKGAKFTWTEQNLLVSVARDLAQQAIVTHSAMSETASATAAAEHALLRGHTAQAVALLIKARNTARSVHNASARGAAKRVV